MCIKNWNKRQICINHDKFILCLGYRNEGSNRFYMYGVKLGYYVGRTGNMKTDDLDTTLSYWKKSLKTFGQVIVGTKCQKDWHFVIFFHEENFYRKI